MEISARKLGAAPLALCLLVLNVAAPGSYGQSRVADAVSLGTNVSIVSAPVIQKDVNTGRFNILLTTRQQFIADGGMVEVTLQGLSDRDGRTIRREVPTQRGDTRIDWSFDLSQLNVPRFTVPMQITAIAKATLRGKFNQASARMPEIKIPVLVVHGIQIFGGSGVDEEFRDYMTSHDYTLYQPGSTAYPTLFWLDHDADSLTLSQSASVLEGLVSSLLAETPQLTYAARLDFVAHSKGGLVGREWIKSYPSRAGVVRKLLMCCSPHTGSVEAYILDDRAAYLELLPTFDWYRNWPWNSFTQDPYNATLHNLNNWPIPGGLEYHLLYGYGDDAWSNVTQYPFPSFSYVEGDFVVSKWSALGYQIINDSSGNSSQGQRIAAFTAQQGPASEIGLPYTHVGYLGSAAAEIWQILQRP